MDELIDQILSSSSWVDMSAVNRSSLNTGDRRPANCMPGDSVGALQGSSRVATMSIVPSSCLSGNSGGQGQNKDAQNGSSNVIADQNTPFLSKKPLIGSQVRKDPIIASPVPGQSQHDSMSTMDVNSRAQANQESAHISLQKQVENNTASGSIGLQLNSDGSASPHGVSSQVSPAVGGATTVAVALPGSASGRTSGNEALGIHRHRGGTHSPVPTESLWCQSYMAGVSPIPSVLAQGKSEAFVLHGETTQGEGHFLGKRCRLEEESQERENRSATTGLDGFRGNPLPSYIGTQAGPTPSNITGGTQPPEQNPGVQMLQSSHGNSLQQHVNQSVISQPQSAATAGAATNGAARPRVRARRGQATDPHSIAERLRRERIAERMKALQELVPNSNKTDKASMLDEIIEYVKFLQLQVKVLSMSRLGGTGAVAPLIADVPSEGSGLVSAALAQASSSLSQSEDGLAFEQKVAKLMESNMTTAMQYLQNKGLCLMPIALATAISSSSGKPLLGAGSMKSVDSACDRKNSDTQPVALTANSCSAAVTIGASGFGSDALLKENLVKKEMREEVAIPTKGAQSWN